TYNYLATATGYLMRNSWQRGGFDLSNGGIVEVGDIALSKAAAITGRVVDEATGEPIISASASASGGRMTGFSFMGGGARTDENGVFLIDDAEIGKLEVAIKAEGYARVKIPGVETKAGKTTDLGEIRLGHGQSLSGRVSEESGAGVAGARVVVFEQRNMRGFTFAMGPKDVVAEAETGADGRYSVGGLPDGEWGIEVTAEGFAPATGSLSIKGAPETMDFTLAGASSITGRMLDASGNPVAGADIVAINHKDGTYMAYKFMPDAARFIGRISGGIGVKTDSEGRFVLGDLPEGKYLLVANKDAIGKADKDNIDLGKGEEKDIGDLQVAGRGSLVVRVTEDGAPVSGLQVSLTAGMGIRMPGSGNSEITDSSGTARFKDVEGGKYIVRTERDPQMLDADIRARRTIEIVSGREESYELELRPRDGIRLHGKLTMNGEAKFSTVILRGVGDISDVIRDTKPEAGGLYEFTGLRPGTYRVSARTGNRALAATFEVTLIENEFEREFSTDFKGFTVSGVVTTPTSAAEELSRVSVTIESMDMVEESLSGMLSGFTNCDERGRYSFSGVIAGNYKVTAVLDGVGTSDLNIKVGQLDLPGQDLRITGNTGGMLARVVKIDGSPVSGGMIGRVQLKDAQGELVNFGERQNGVLIGVEVGKTVEFDTLQPGIYTVIMRISGYVTATRENVVVKRGETTTVEFELQAAAELHGTFTNTEVTQELLVGARVKYYTSSGVEINQEEDIFGSLTGEATFEVPTLKVPQIGPDCAEVRVKVAGYQELRVPVVFEAGKKIEKVLTLVAE
ncbi:MAG: carboxypeptidase-like regulatory domain-containing protein, partial [Nitrospira sp.]|nr:carboxypeptidase-like regulatory domain-containing protein [Nitrospira sp.]